MNIKSRDAHQNSFILGRCEKCGRREPFEKMHIAQNGEVLARFCTECWRSLEEKNKG